MPILLWLIVITLTDTGPNVGPSGLGEAGGAQSIVYKHRKTFTNSLGQQKDRAKHKEKHLHGSYGADARNAYKITYTHNIYTLKHTNT